jgi:hypothetical protein
MKVAAASAAMLLLAACGRGDVIGDSDEAVLENAAQALDATAKTETDQQIARIKAESLRKADAQ